jgi:hypothetical protein
MESAEGLVADLVGFGITAGVPLYFVLQAWLLWRLRGGWRGAAAIPLLPMAAVLAYTFYAFLDGSNLFPLVLIFTAPIAALYLLAIMALRRLRRQSV